MSGGAGGAVAAQIGADIIGNAVPMFYNHWLNQQTWQREDTAVQRHMADLRAAGLNPTLAVGGQAQTSSGHSMPQGQIKDYITRNAEADMLKKQNESLLEQITNLRKSGLNLDKDLEVKDQEIANMKATEANTRAQTFATNQETKFAAIDAQKNYGAGMTRNPSQIGGMARDLALTAQQFVDGIAKANIPNFTKKTITWGINNLVKAAQNMMTSGKLSIREAQQWLKNKLDALTKSIEE